MCKLHRLQIVLIVLLLGLANVLADRSNDLKRVYIVTKQKSLLPAASFLNDTKLPKQNWTFDLLKLNQLEEQGLADVGRLLKSEYGNKFSSSNTKIHTQNNRLASESARDLLKGIVPVRAPYDSNENITSWVIKEDGDRKFCAAGLIELRQGTKSSEAANLLLKHASLVNKVKEEGKVTDPNAIHFETLTRLLTKGKHLNSSFPSWLNKEDRQELTNLTQSSLMQLLQKPAVRALLVGPIIRRLQNDLIEAALDFKPNDVLRNVIYVVHESELNALTLLLNVTQLNAFESGSALLFEQYANGSIVIKFINRDQIRTAPNPNCSVIDRSISSDCDSITLIKQFNRLLSDDWKRLCSISKESDSLFHENEEDEDEDEDDKDEDDDNSKKNNKLLPYSESKVNKLAEVIERFREQNRTLNLKPIFNKAPEMLNLIEQANRLNVSKKAKHFKSKQFELEKEQEAKGDEDEQEVEQQSESKRGKIDLKTLLKEEIDKSLRKQMEKQQKSQQRKDSFKSLLHQLLSNNQSEYDEIVDEWTNRTSRTQIDLNTIARRAYDRKQRNKEKQRQLLRNLIERLKSELNEQQQIERTSNRDQEKLKKMINLISNGYKPKQNNRKQEVTEKLLQSRVSHPTEDHVDSYQRRLVSSLSVIEELNEDDLDDEDDDPIEPSNESNESNETDSDYEPEMNQKVDKEKEDSRQISKLNGLQRLLVRAAEYRAKKLQQMRNMSESIRSKLSDRKKRKENRLELEQRIKTMLNQQADEQQVKEFENRMLNKMAQVRESDKYVQELFDYIDQTPSSNRLVSELRYKTLGELLRYAKKSEEMKSNEWSDLMDMLINRRRLRSMASVEVNQFLDQMTTSVPFIESTSTLKEDQVHQNKSIVLLRSSSPDALIDVTSSSSTKSIWLGAFVGLILFGLVAAIVVMIIRRQNNKRKQYVRM